MISVTDKAMMFDRIQKALWDTAGGINTVSGVSISPSEAINLIQRLNIPKTDVEENLWQLHWQFRDGRTEFCAQHSFLTPPTPTEVRDWVEDIKTRHPLPNDAVWLMCNENDPNFVKCPVKEEGRPPGLIETGIWQAGASFDSEY